MAKLLEEKVGVGKLSFLKYNESHAKHLYEISRS